LPPVAAALVPMPTVFLSDAICGERLPFGATIPVSTPERRRWLKLSAFYRASLTACGLRVMPSWRPEIYQSEVARQVTGFTDGDWHLAVKPIEHIRPFHGVPNVFVCDWALPELSRSSHGVSPFLDHLRLLGHADAVICCTEFTASTLRATGIANAICLPPCFPPAEVTDCGPNRTDTTTTFLLHADMDRLPQQAGTAIDAFRQAKAQRDGLRLRVRIDTGSARPAAALQQQASWELGVAELDDAVTFEFDVPGDPIQHRAVDFVLCTRAASGLPIELVEAMLAGVPVVTPLHSGISSVLTSNVVIPVSTEAALVTEDEEPIARFMPLTCHRPTPASLCQALLTASDLSDDARAGLGAAVRRIAESRFSLTVFQTGLSALAPLMRI
jgi:glycosyltransferase involved in cell wall biosynthesis